jgi:uncharacterized ion transporter superfamily protein YfcC
MAEEIIALVSVLMLVTRRLGFDAITAMAISIGATGCGPRTRCSSLCPRSSRRSCFECRRFRFGAGRRD